MLKAPCERPFRLKGDTASGYPEAITAEEFCLVDKKRNVRALLSLNEDKLPRLLFFDSNEKLRLALYIEDAHSGIELLDKNEKTRAALGLGNNGQPSLLLLDKEEKVHAALEMGEDGGPGLDLYDPKGELRASLSLFSNNDISHLALVDKDGRRRNAPGTENGGQPLLVLYGSDGEAIDMLGGECDEGSA